MNCYYPKKTIKILISAALSASLFLCSCSAPLPWISGTSQETGSTAEAAAAPASEALSEDAFVPGEVDVIEGDGVQITVSYPERTDSGETSDSSAIVQNAFDAANENEPAVSSSADSMSSAKGKDTEEKSPDSSKKEEKNIQEYYATNRFTGIDLDKEVNKRLTVDLIQQSEYARPGNIIANNIHAVAVHYLANPGSNAKANRDYFDSLAQTHAEYASCHFVVGLEGEIIQLIPMTEISFCTNSRNMDTISIECCHPDETGYYNDATYISLVILTAWVLKQHHLTYQNIIRHFDANGKICPLAFVKDADYWYHFKFNVACALGEKVSYKHMVASSTDSFLTEEEIQRQYAEQKKIAEEEARAAEEAAFYESLVEEGAGYFGEDGLFYFYEVYDDDYYEDDYYEDYYDDDYYY